MSSIVHPLHYRVFRREGCDWFLKDAEIFHNPRCQSVEVDDFEKLYGIPAKDVLVELFRLNGGRSGYYLANLKEQKYYYCGTEWSSVQAKLLELGIGRKDPMEGFSSSESHGS